VQATLRQLLVNSPSRVEREAHAGEPKRKACDRDASNPSSQHRWKLSTRKRNGIPRTEKPRGPVLHDPVMDQLDRLLTVGELAGYLGVPVATLYALATPTSGPSWIEGRQTPPAPTQ
jgi:hypothetical protein